ncbi:Metallo-peptidase family M12B Reprolysin-like [Roseateles sp. YR242]|uniref:M12 family metallo-peptidase n=1 Tax=Roseateles sp. YR242 TaxID=1855305 RepID=UPI0008C4017E|nr:M12 family metallo-peptidase [Roseateles sp. YR242]SEL73176.1 Metallo-peptidase family M12B Reprolysin-like [Roseateles sp. YR242]
MKNIALIVLTFLLIAGAHAQVHAQGASLLASSGIIKREQESIALPQAARDRLVEIRRNPSTRTAIAAFIDTRAFSSTIVAIQMPDGMRLSLRRTKEEHHTDGSITWFGDIDAGGKAVVTVQGTQIYGSLQTPSHRYIIRSLSDSLHAFIEINPSGFQPEHPPSAPAGAESASEGGMSTTANLVHGSTATRATSSNAPSTLNVFIAFTPNAERYVGNIQAASQTAVGSLNDSFLYSNINLRARLVGITSTPKNYGNSVKARDAAMRSNAIIKARNESEADIVIIVDTIETDCGVSKQILATPETAFASIAADCFVGNYSLAHEIGHLLGARHDVAHDPTPTPFRYGHGYQLHERATGDCYHDIMAYPQACAGDSRVNAWSDPKRVAFSYGSPAGRVDVHFGNEQSNTVLVLNSTGHQAAKFRSTKLSSNSPSFISKLLGVVFF